MKYEIYAGNCRADGLIHCDQSLGIVTAWSLEGAKHKAGQIAAMKHYDGFVLRGIGRRKYRKK